MFVSAILMKSQVMQTLVGLLLGAITSEENLDHSCLELSLWERRIQSVLLLSMSAIATKNLSPTHAVVPWPSADLTLSLEYYTYIGQAARVFYHWIMPLLRFYIALWLADTWVFFVHRAEHSNRWLYSEYRSHYEQSMVDHCTQKRFTPVTTNCSYRTAGVVSTIIPSKVSSSASGLSRLQLEALECRSGRP